MSSKDDKGKLTTTQEILPPERRSVNVPSVPMHNPQGIVHSVSSGLMSRVRARSVADYNNLLREKLGTIEISTEIAEALYHNYLAWEVIERIGDILDARERQRAHDTLVIRLKRREEIASAEAAAEEAEARRDQARQARRRQHQEAERENERAASLVEQQRWRNKAEEEDARAHYVAQLRDRLLIETIRDAVIQTRATLEETKSADARAKLSLALKALETLSQKSKPEPKTNDNTALQSLAATFKQKMALANDRHNYTEVGIYAMALAEVEEQLAKNKGPPGGRP